MKLASIFIYLSDRVDPHSRFWMPYTHTLSWGDSMLRLELPRFGHDFTDISNDFTTRKETATPIIFSAENVGFRGVFIPPNGQQQQKMRLARLC